MPAVRKRIMQWLWFLPDRLSDKYGDARMFASWTDRPWEWLDAITVWAGKATCLFAGHEPTRDQCGRPEHDFCIWCQKPMPGQAEPYIAAERAD